MTSKDSVVSRRTALKTVGLGGLAGLAGCMGSGSETTLVLSTYGGAFEEHMRTNVADPFEEQSDEDVNVELTPYAQIAELEGMQDDPQIDVANLDDFYLFLADDDLFLDYDPDILVNENDHFEIAQMEQDYAVNSYMYRYGLAINTDSVNPDDIESYADLWDEEYEDNIAIHTDWNPIMILLSIAMGGDEYDMDPLWDNLPELADNVSVFYEDAPDPELYLGEGQVEIASWFDGRAGFMNDDGHPIEFHMPPEEGGIAGRGSLVVMSNTDYPELSQELVNYAVGPEAQQGYAEDLYYGPVNSEAEIDGLADQVATEDDFDLLTVPDWEHVMSEADTWRDNWNENI